MNLSEDNFQAMDHQRQIPVIQNPKLKFEKVIFRNRVVNLIVNKVYKKESDQEGSFFLSLVPYFFERFRIIE